MRIVAVVLALVTCLSALVWAEDYASLVQEAEAKYRAKEYSAALELYRKAFEIGEPGFLDYYNAACVASLAGDVDAAFTYLTGGIEAGPAGAEWDQWVEDDLDLASLRSDSRWETLKADLRKRRDDMQASFPEARAEGRVIDLPQPRLEGEVSVEKALQNRRSVRSYTDSSLTLADISQLLWSAYGITAPVDSGPAFLRGGMRTAPSAGALYPLEIYLAARRVSGLAPGIYWYNSETHKLVAVLEDDRWSALTEACLYQPHFETAAAAIVYSAIYERTTSKYGQRGRERYVCMDLGHSAENVYLEAYALKIGTCAIGAFIDMALKQAIGMTRAEEPLYVMPVGRLE